MLVPWDITCLWCTWPWKANTHVGIKIISLPPTSQKKRCQTTLGSYKTSTVRPNPSTHWSIQVKVPCSLPRRYRAWRLPGSYRPPRVFLKVETSRAKSNKQQSTKKNCPREEKQITKKKQVQWHGNGISAGQFLQQETPALSHLPTTPPGRSSNLHVPPPQQFRYCCTQGWHWPMCEALPPSGVWWKGKVSV